jgi:hypothetical protein
MLAVLLVPVIAATGNSPGIIISSLIGYALYVIALWRIFEKAGQPGWAAIVPVYNWLILLRIIGRPWWWLLLTLVPIVNIVVIIMVYNDLSKSFGHGVGFTIGLIFLQIIFLLILAFNDSRYRGPAGSNMPLAPAMT